MARIQLEVKMKGIYSFEAPAYGYGFETRYIYTMEGQDGTIYVWKTTAVLFAKTQTDSTYDYAEIDSKGRKWVYDKIRKDDELIIKATIKGESEYKGQPQTELSRVSLVERTFRAKSDEEIAAERKAERIAKKQEQLEGIRREDFIWRMPYKQYKEHYSDCETVIDSYEKRDYTPGTIEVIIRAGRLVPSGVRGQCFHGYEFHVTDEDGKKYRQCYRAVCEDNALRRCKKEFPNALEIVPGKIYDYGA